MACHKSSKKSIRKTIRQTEVNTSRLSRIKTFIKKVEQAILGHRENGQILDAFSKAQKEIMKGAAKNIMHKNTASRKISRLHKKVKIATGGVEVATEEVKVATGGVEVVTEEVKVATGGVEVATGEVKVATGEGK
ncbi:MAG: 30S ribosomal protein S20 [Holosporales bacterium]|jgi:small subunit ribosomal protein S20|nr:30S ribosomal protein S20 [Holosporales bacterium]